jgi:diguanylate cyclase (GGDEF)-like protein
MKDTLTVEYANNIIKKMKLDSLTQLYRKDLFEEILNKELKSQRSNDDYNYLSIVFIDIDDFKLINDKYGHYTGDKVIEKFGEIVKKNIRSSDIGFRIGGDEFAILLKNANADIAKKVALKISHDSIIKNVDKKLYISKKNGKNQITV